jgi:hypothetical protein
MAPSTVPTDHWMVSLRYAPKDTPYIGTGRWTMPIKATKDRKIIDKIKENGMRLQEELKELRENPETRTQEKNPQNLWKNFKYISAKWAEFVTKNTHYKRATKLKNLHRDRKALLENPEFETNQDLQWNEALITKEIEYLERKTSKENRGITNAKIVTHGEKLGGMWSALSKSKKPRDLMRRLKIPNSTPPLYAERSDKMAALARQYHNEIQNRDMGTSTRERRERATENALNAIPDEQKFPDPLNSTLNENVSGMFVEMALKKAKNGSATGLDGCPYELWKTLNWEYQEARKLNRPGFDIVGTLTAVFNDIQEHGIENNTDFTEGWMCPLYKKKDKTEIENYRPITLLNTDYKLLTKALSLQLLEAIKHIVHKDQAGFIPGRSIFNHIRLTKIMIQYAEATEHNGAIIALDQEKAYDRITHEYLWKVLEAFELPEHFINTVKTLYKAAETTVIINGVKSDPFPVNRGVRQGDPISCFLFNIGIEPLACMIRNDNKVKGFHIPGTEDQCHGRVYLFCFSVFEVLIIRYDKMVSHMMPTCAFIFVIKGM